MMPQFVSWLITTLIFLSWAVGSYAANDLRYLNCSSPIQCGSLSNIGYPFWGMNRASYCGMSQFQLTCQDSTTPLISISGFDFRVLQVDTASRIMTVASSDYWNNLCPTSFHNTTQEIPAPFSYTSDTVPSNLTLYYGCAASQLPTPLLVSSQFNCSINRTTVAAYYVTKKVSDISSYANLNLTSIMKYFVACKTSVVLAANQTAVQAIERNPTEQTVQNAVDQGFGLQWDYTIYKTCESCVASGGQCGTDASSGNFACYCVDKAYSSTCPGDRIGTPNAVRSSCKACQ